jgi:hypothetical protein
MDVLYVCVVCLYACSFVIICLYVWSFVIISCSSWEILQVLPIISLSIVTSPRSVVFWYCYL